MRADESGTTAGYAPYLDYRPLQEEEKHYSPPARNGLVAKGIRGKGDKLRYPEVGPRPLGGSEKPARGVNLQDNSGGKGSADQRDQLLGPPGTRAESR